MTAGSAFCAICLQSRSKNENWFLLLENRWTDRLKILGWNERLASHPRIHVACSVGHVQQLVVHWMTTGTLDYPFACSRFSDTEPTAFPPDSPLPQNEPDTAEAAVLGELAVDRESVERVLITNPGSLGSLLAALRETLSGHSGTREAEEHKTVEIDEYALADA